MELDSCEIQTILVKCKQLLGAISLVFRLITVVYCRILRLIRVQIGSAAADLSFWGLGIYKYWLKIKFDEMN